MTRAKFTPGPWLVRIDGTCTGRGPEIYIEGAYYEGGGEFIVADCGCSEATGGGGSKRWKRQPDADMIDANARLISAAPELLAACKSMHKALDVLAAMLCEKDHTFFPSKSAAWPAVLEGLAAIKKAEAK